MKPPSPPPRAVALFALLVITVSWLPSQAHAQLQAECIPSPPGLIAWWPGDSHSFDIIGWNDGILQNGASYSSGQIREAFAFATADAKVRINERPATDLSRRLQWTIEAWVKPASFTNASYPTLYSEGARVVSLGLAGPGGLPDSWINGANRIIGTIPLRLNEWNHVALVYNLFAGTRTFYVNGEPAGTGTAPLINGDSSGAAMGHTTLNNPITSFQGSIDELSLYDRALEAGEISDLYNAATAGKAYNTAPLPSFVLEPHTKTDYLAEDVILKGAAMGCPRPDYQWLFNNTPLPGETNFMLQLTGITFSQDGEYALVAQNDSGSVTSAVARLTVKFCTDAPDGLIAWWPGDGSGLSATDEHHGSVWGGITYPEGIAGPAFHFDGVDDYVAVPDAPELSPHTGTDAEMSLEAWVYVSSLPQADPATGAPWRIVAAKGDEGRWEYALRIGTDGVPSFSLYDAENSTWVSAEGGEILLNQWHHLVGTFKRGEFLRLYQDRQLMHENTNANFVTLDGPAPFYLGRDANGVFLDGNMDEVALYKRALTSAEITVLNTGGSFGKCLGASEPAPSFVVQPANQQGYLLLSQGLSALALATPRPEYQWFRSNATEWIALPTETNATLGFSGLTTNEEGFYKVTASNVYGTAESEPAYLQVVPHPILTGGDDFELGWNGWTTSNHALWQVGRPTSGPPAVNGERASSGTVCAATILAGNYPYGPDALLMTPPLDLPSILDGEELVLQFQQWFHYWYGYWSDGCNGGWGGNDNGKVQVQVYDANTRTWSGWTTLLTVSRQSAAWTPAQLDLSAYSGQRVRVGFLHTDATEDPSGCNGTHHYESMGWYIDDVSIQHRHATVLTECEDFEEGWNGWHVEAGVWQIGAYTNAFSGNQCAGTILGGNYPWETDSRLISPNIRIPAAQEGERVVLKFWQWFSYWYSYWSDGCNGGWGGNDNGKVQLQVYDADSRTWSDWITLLTVSRYSAAWAPEQADLTPYAGHAARLGFLHSDVTEDTSGCNSIHHYESTGWYIDDICIEKQPIVVVNTRVDWDFEGEWDGWTATGIWELGPPSSGPGSARTGTQCVGTVLAGSYPWETDSTLLSPVITLPSVNAGEEIALELWQWFSYWYSYWSDGCNGGWGGNDYGQVRVQVFDTETLTWSAWTPLLTVSRYSAGWSPTQADLTPHAGKQIRIGFLHSDVTEDTSGCNGIHHYQSSGWYIDDIRIERRPIQALSGSEGFELEWNGWFADQGIWEVGPPTSGPGAAHSGSACAGTVLNGNYPWETDSRLISPGIDLPLLSVDEPLGLKFWQWFNYWSGNFSDGCNAGFKAVDAGNVQVQVFNSDTLEWSSWTNLTAVTRSSTEWEPLLVDLSDYASQRVRFGFQHTDSVEDTSGCNGIHHYESSGWYIDDLFVKRGNIAITEIPDQIVDEGGQVSFCVTVVGSQASPCYGFSLPPGAPEGAWINPATGCFTWTPSECQGPGTYRIAIQVVDYCNNEANDLGFVTITVNELNERPWLASSVRSIPALETLEFAVCAGDPDCPRNPLQFTLLENAPAGAAIDPDTGLFTWTPDLSQLGTHQIGVRLEDHGTPSFSTNNILTITVTTNICSLDVQPLSDGSIGCTILGGRTDIDYVLQEANAVCECPRQIDYRDVMIISPDAVPYTFVYAPSEAHRFRLFRLRELERLR